MGLGINTIALLEIREEGVQWNNFYEDISLDDDFHLGYVFLMLIIDSIVYMLVAWYEFLQNCLLHCTCIHVQCMYMVYLYMCTCIMLIAW